MWRPKVAAAAFICWRGGREPPPRFGHSSTARVINNLKHAPKVTPLQRQVYPIDRVNALKSHGRSVIVCPFGGHRANLRRGSISLLLLGSLSVLLIITLTLFQRFSRHKVLVFHGDRTTIARVVLEAFASDLVHQFRQRANDPASALYSQIRPSLPSNGNALVSLDITPDSFGYAYSPALQEIIDQYSQDQRFAVALLPAEINIGLEPMKLPTGMFSYKNPSKAPQEWKGKLSLSLRAKFGNGITYVLRVAYPFRVVFVLVAFLREFAWFFDRIAELQSDPNNDPINGLLIQNDGIANPHPQPWPLVLDAFQPLSAAPLFNQFEMPGLAGQIFLGPDDKDVVLNFTGEYNPGSSLLNDLWYHLNKSGEE